MKVLYMSMGAEPATMTLDALIAQFDASGGWYPRRHRDALLEDMRADLAGCGWYENQHRSGRYLVMNLDIIKFAWNATDDAESGEFV